MAVTAETRPAPAPGPPPGRTSPMELGQWVVVAAVVVVLVVMAWRGRWMSDDGFIHLRVVEQVAAGHGPVFNVGERVEASTSPLWVALLVLAHPVTGVALPWKAVVLGIALAALGVGAAQRAAVLLGRAAGATGLILPVGAIVVVALPPFWDYASSGLETGMVFAWMGGSSWWVARRVTAPAPPGRAAELAGGALVGLGPLIRPDLAIYTALWSAILLVAAWPRGRRTRAGLAVAIVALPVAYQLFRMGYYAALVPNTAIAKEAAEPQWGQGWAYLIDLVGPYRLWIPLAVLVVVLAAQGRADLEAGARLRAAARLGPAVAAVAHAVYITRVGGDFMHARLLLPAVFALAAPVHLAVPAGDGRHAAGLRRAAVPAIGAVVALWALTCALWLRSDLSSPGIGGGTVPVSADGTIEDERPFFQQLWNTEHPVRLDRLYIAADPGGERRDAEPGSVLVMSYDPLEFLRLPFRDDRPTASGEAAATIGMASVAAGPDVHIVDLWGLAHPVGGRLDIVTSDRPGHQKRLPLVWQVADTSTVSQVRRADGTVAVSRADLESARAALGCGRLRRYLDGVSEPLTPRRFLANVVDSVANTRLRVSPDPAEAEGELCGRDDD